MIKMESLNEYEYDTEYDKWIDTSSINIEKRQINFFDGNVYRFYMHDINFNVVEQEHIIDKITLNKDIPLQRNKYYKFIHKRVYPLSGYRRDPDNKQYHNIVGTNLVQFPITNMNNPSNNYCHLLSVLSLLSSCDLLVVSVLDTVINKNYNSLPENTLGHFDKVNEKYVMHESIPDDKVYNNKNNAYFGDIEDNKDGKVSKLFSIISSSNNLSEINKMFTTDK